MYFSSHSPKTSQSSSQKFKQIKSPHNLITTTQYKLTVKTHASFESTRMPQYLLQSLLKVPHSTVGSQSGRSREFF